MNKKVRKIGAILFLFMILFSNCFNVIYASTQITEAYIQKVGDAPHHLQHYNASKKAYTYVVCSIVGHNQNGIFYPAYCLNHDLDGAEKGAYTVNIDEAYNNPAVWRVIKNGYPYNNMGLSDWDAFAVTKMAVYCVLGQSNLADFRAAPGDGTAEAMMAQLNNLVNIGFNGGESQAVGTVSINKNGELVEEGDYYSQNYSVSSNVEMSQFTITNIANFPEGSYVANNGGAAQNTFGNGETFKIMIPANSLGQDINGMIFVQAKCKTYPILYGRSSVAGKQDYMVTMDPYGDDSNNIPLNVKTNTGKIEIVKNDAETNLPIEGVTFQLLKQDGTVVATATTNANGQATFSDLYQADYVLKEIDTNENYILNEQSFPINVKYNKTTPITITNEHKRGNLVVYKVDKDNNKVVLGDVEFDLYSEEFGRVIGTYHTNVNGEIRVENLRTGNYKLIEKTTNQWYDLASDTNIVVKWNEDNPTKVENELKKGQIKVIKVDLDKTEVKLEGVEFEVLDENDKVLETITTDANGEALTNRYAVRDFEKLKLRETKTLENYVLNDEEKTIVLKENQIENITFENEKKKGQIKVIKVDLDNNEVKIPDVEFNVYDEANQIVDTLVTDENGEAISKRLPIDQEYKVQETKTGEWYVLNEEPQTAILEQDQITELTFENEKKKGQVRVIKVDLDDNEVLLEGVTFEILDEDENVVDTVVTDKNGEATTKRLPIDQQYTVVEKETRKEYVLTEETQTVELKQDEITSITFENEKIKGYVEVTKVDSETKETLEGAEFGIYNENDELIGTIKTDKTGKAKSELIPYGKYYLKELDTGSVYYLLNENTYNFEIVNNHETVPVTIENDGVDIEVTVEKQGTTEIKPGEKVDYIFSNVGNASNVYLENFKWFDYIPTDYIRLEKMTTGTWNQDLVYDVYYKTNMSEDYILFKEDLITSENYDLDFTTVELTDNEYITETCFDFGKVDVGFKEDTKPTMQCQSLDTLKDGDTFTNHTKTIGTYYGITTEANSKWTTITHIPQAIPSNTPQATPVLPKTGK